jgi:putative ABC transport system permease protein
MLALVFGTLRRSLLRTVLIGLSTLVAFMLLGFFLAIRHSFATGPAQVGADLLLLQPLDPRSELPVGVLSTVTTFPGVRTAAAFTGSAMRFGADPHPVRLEALSSRAFLAISGLVAAGTLPSGQATAWLADPIGALVSADIARKNSWRIGQTLTLHAMPGENLPDLTLQIDGIIARHHGVSLSTDINLHLGYFRRWAHTDLVSAIFVQVREPNQADAVAHAMELRFANSTTPVNIQTFKSLLQGMFSRLANVNSITSVVISASLFGLFLICFNTLIHSVSDRLEQFALLRAVGFSPARLVWLVFAEAFFTITPGAAIGILCGVLIIRPLATAKLNLPGVILTPSALTESALIAVCLAFLCSVLPSVQIARLNCAELLRKG